MDEDIKKLVEENLELTKQLAKDVRKIKRHFLWTSIWSVIKITVFLAPIVAGYFYLRPYFAQLQSTYQELLGLQRQVSGFTEDIGQIQKNIGELGNVTGQLKGLQIPEQKGGAGFSLPKIPGLEFLFGEKKE